MPASQQDTTHPTQAMQDFNTEQDWRVEVCNLLRSLAEPIENNDHEDVETLTKVLIARYAHRIKQILEADPATSIFFVKGSPTTSTKPPLPANGYTSNHNPTPVSPSQPQTSVSTLNGVTNILLFIGAHMLRYGLGGFLVAFYLIHYIRFIHPDPTLPYWINAIFTPLFRSPLDGPIDDNICEVLRLFFPEFVVLVISVYYLCATSWSTLSFLVLRLCWQGIRVVWNGDVGTWRGI